jgi:crotonobetainyl-CoA:carnitine CoA-transferase CaiB-like acyl-CoA transferase
VIAAPFAGTILADLGADVLKLEKSLHPDESRK